MNIKNIKKKQITISYTIQYKKKEKTIDKNGQEFSHDSVLK